MKKFKAYIIVMIVIFVGLFVFNSSTKINAKSEDVSSDEIDEFQEDINPELAHWRNQYYSLQSEFNILVKEKEELEAKLMETNYDINKDEVVTICDAVELLHYISEIS